jgi:hypothetical protein
MLDGPQDVPLPRRAGGRQLTGRERVVVEQEDAQGAVVRAALDLLLQPRRLLGEQPAAVPLQHRGGQPGVRAGGGGQGRP